MIVLDSLMVKIALIGLLGVGAQWIAWRINKPAIALMLFAGVMAGPVLGIINPRADFGTLLEPIVKLAVAVILFEGGLSLNFKDLRHAGSGVLRLVIVGVPVGWVLGTMAGYYGANLSLGVAALFGGILVVTGPTVIGPMLRSLRVGNRVRDILKWEGIVNDPIGALLAVAIYTYIHYVSLNAGPVNLVEISAIVLGSSIIAGAIGAALGFALVYIFPRGWVPEYLKAPVLLVAVIGGFVGADLIMHETGLITVTIMGVVMANRPTFSSRALRRFKEDLSVLLISGVFILLSATLDWETMQKFQPIFLVFLGMLLFIVRPVTVLTSLAFSDVPWRERLFIAWIAPRGVVAIAVTSLFAIRLVELGYEGADALIPLVFGVVIVTIFAHGFSAGYVARFLGIDQGKSEDILLVGSNRWNIAFGKFLSSMDLNVVIADQSKYALRNARKAGLETHCGEVSESAHGHELDIGRFQHLLVGTEGDSYNLLVANDLGPEVGFESLTIMSGEDAINHHNRARVLFASGASFELLDDRIYSGWEFSKTRITEKFTYSDFRANLIEDEEPVAVLKPDNRLLFFAVGSSPTVEPDDVIISFVQPDTPEERKAQREAEKQRNDK
ncbi:sodium:proton antiporter [Sphingorhabdus lutea]|uniref:Sodium:proton antiporter n=1 Tax=Sphingorhabdus lutea TaxID=1913578 RepID=A0A1L3J8M5_9SPHN|nr:sodium:proton antiporter [Sphingorhabdus lutea]APG61492.1 sodium:proton antiporter [Sphingorhabdus lutea]APG63397.1 sodium:proton antiporter [Sphingorhabdus lutea]